MTVGTSNNGAVGSEELGARVAKGGAGQRNE